MAPEMMLDIDQDLIEEFLLLSILERPGITIFTETIV